MLYRLSMSNLSRHSQVLADMFVSAKENPHEDDSDNNPIEILQLLSSTFNLFIEHISGL